MFRESIIFFILFLVLVFASLFFAVDAKNRIKYDGENFIKVNLVKKYGLTDLSIFTDASYTRHLSQSDFFSPFQDNPSSFDMFPSASFVTPLSLRFEK